MTIDSHQHFWTYGPPRHKWITNDMALLKRDFLPDEFDRELDANSVDASVLVQVNQYEKETRFLLELADRSPRIAGVVGWTDLHSSDLAENLRHYSQYKKLRGFRQFSPIPHDRFLRGGDFLNGVSMLHQFGFTFDILIYPKQLPGAINLVSQLPEQRFVLDHLAKPEIKAHIIEPWAERIRTLAQAKNVYCKLSGMVTEADWKNWKPEEFTPYLDVVFEAFGPQRLMFGSDWPVCLLAASYSQVKQLIDSYVDAHAPQHKADIFGGNAMRFYGLKATTHGLAA
jgi:L-fuconolactonase